MSHVHHEAKIMKRMRFGATTWTLAGGVAAIVAGALVAHTTLSSATQAPALERGNKPGEWRYWGADAWSTRYSAADQITPANFDSLQVAWRWDAGKYGGD